MAKCRYPGTIFVDSRVLQSDLGLYIYYFLKPNNHEEGGWNIKPKWKNMELYETEKI